MQPDDSRLPWSATLARSCGSSLLNLVDNAVKFTDEGVLDQLEAIAQELVKQIDGLTVEALRPVREKKVDEHSGTAGP